MSRGRQVARWTLWIGGIGAVAGISAGVGFLAVIYAMVYFGDDSHLKKSTIMARINEETTIYMLDEETQIGSFFSDSHRRYVPISEVPAHMINAIIASEDKNFYEHNGVDPVAIAVAGVQWLQGGRMRGASTLTQQTVRNIMGWWEVTLARKFREWIAAMQIERLYAKRDILEFYLNQFYVSGNGNGIGIAARYYFNKDVRDLDLVESAFIAGSVKGPSQYDPFIKFTKERREKAIERAFDRKNYVLKRMFEQQWITEEQFKEAYEKPVAFNRGHFRSQEVALVQLIKKELSRKEILEAVGLETERELSRAGLRVYTTIDGELQEKGQLAMRRNLSRLDTILKGFAPEDPERYKRLRGLTPEQFYYAKVLEVGGTDKEPELKVDFGLPKGTIPFESIKRYSHWLDFAHGRGWESQMKKMMGAIKPGDVVFVEVREYDPETHEAIAEMHKRPEINGGLMAIDKGEVRTVISGFDTAGFNRAVRAKRQPGSVFKPLSYFAALTLGWSILDRLDNQRQVFPFQGQFYYPSPDHSSPYRTSSLLWSGIMSENLATISLVQRMVEKLNFEQFKQLMGTLELLPLEDESARDYHYRVSRAVGVSVDNDGIKEFQLQQALSDLLLDVQYTASFEFQAKLRKMWYGRGYAAEMRNIYEIDEEDVSARLKAIRLTLLENNYQRHLRLKTDLLTDWTAIANAVQESSIEAAFADPSIQHIFKRFRVLPGAGNRPELGYFRQFEDELPTDETLIAPVAQFIQRPGRELNSLDAQVIWGQTSFFTSAGVEVTDVLLDGWLSQGRLAILDGYMDQRYQDVLAREEPFDLHRYWQHHDFRLALGLEYMVALTEAMGVTSKIEPILSFPLGSNDVSVAEVAKIYQTMTSGKTYRYYKEGPPNQLNYIRRIEDRFGKVLFEPEREVTQLVLPEFALQMREILRRAVTHGTGRQAHGEMYIKLDAEDMTERGQEANKATHVRVPVFGKTGTTNDYTNAYFAGYVPYPTVKGEPLDAENSYIISSYVGYDLNQSMRAGYLKISGARGALPAWIGLGKAMFEAKDYKDYLDVFDINILSRKEWPLKYPAKLMPIKVDMPRGVVLTRNRNEDQESFAITDIDVEGETNFDEFRANVVKSTIRLPMTSGGEPQRLFKPVVLRTGDEESEPEEVQASPIQDRSERMSLSSSTGGTDTDRRVDPAPNRGPQNRPDPVTPRPNPTQPTGNDDDAANNDVLDIAPLEEEQPVVQPDANQQAPEEDGGFEDDDLW